MISRADFDSTNAKIKQRVKPSRRSLFQQNTVVNEQRSGGLIDTFYLAIVDQFGQIVASDNSSSVSLYTNSDNAIIEGGQVFTLTNGMVEISTLTFTSTPGTSHQIQFFSTGIAEISESKTQHLPYRHSIHSNRVTEVLQRRGGIHH